MKNDKITKDTQLLLLFITILYVYHHVLILYAHYKVYLRFYDNGT